jgi:hypothetical protein
MHAHRIPVVVCGYAAAHAFSDGSRNGKTIPADAKIVGQYFVTCFMSSLLTTKR